MFNKISRIFYVASALSGVLSFGLQAQEVHPDCEAEVVKLVVGNLKAALPSTKIKQVQCSGIPGFYEVQAGKNLFYTDKDVSYLFVGGFYRISDKVDVTGAALEATGTKPGVPASAPQAKPAKPTKINLDGMPSSEITFGTGSKRIHVFTDPNCPHCNRAHHAIKRLIEEGLDITLIEHPSGILRNSDHAAIAIHCSKDKAQALEDQYTGFYPEGYCEDGFEKNEEIKEHFISLGLRGVPAFIAETGEYYSGFAGPKEFVDWFNNLSGETVTPAQAQTEDKNVSANLVSWSDLPATPLVHGKKGGPKVALLTHPKCEVCRNLHSNLKDLADFEIHEYLYSKSNDGMLQGIYCDENPVEVLGQAMAGKVFTVKTNDTCGLKVQKETQAFAEKYNLDVTPVFIREDGAVKKGYSDIASLQAWLVEASATDAVEVRNSGAAE